MMLRVAVPGEIENARLHSPERRRTVESCALITPRGEAQRVRPTVRTLGAAQPRAPLEAQGWHRLTTRSAWPAGMDDLMPFDR